MRRWSAACLSSCPLGAGGAGFEDLPALSLCVPCLLSALLLCACRVACKYGFIWLSFGVFSGFRGCRVGLYYLRALRRLWGFCVREWLGGFMACGVFALVFVL